ncbi:hypothetical protein POL68_17260 [Stigmatella sp. ncwal1]|uniref:Uncharacterized protein n=1 Tax=Stigmatella ashevillensis TaxID=2995309 RepID=A0ABT5DAZ8_9BACT|nr:hypothetical protein [Stigmatella ashevillena]MDC0710229.1 hypothetical protein [Stigmatella ashevillena]
MNSWRSLRPLVLGGMLLQSLAAGGAPAAPKPSLVSVEARVYDRQKGAIVSVEEASDPYGMNVDAFIVVKVQGTHEGDAPLKLKLVVSAPKESSEASGDRPAWKVTQTRTLHALSEEGTTQVPFLLPYACASKVQVTVTLTGPGVKGSKTLDTSFPCAE